MLSEILRLEMMPLGFKVLTVNSGLIRRNLTRNSTEFRLPPDSLYKSIDGDIEARAKMEDLTRSESEPEVYAESIVRDVLANTEGTIWRGAFASALCCRQMALPKFLLVSLFLHDWKFALCEGSLTKGAGNTADHRKRIELTPGLEGFRRHVIYTRDVNRDLC